MFGDTSRQVDEDRIFLDVAADRRRRSSFNSRGMLTIAVRPPPPQR